MADKAAAGDDGLFETSTFERVLQQRLPVRLIGWRLRGLLVVALLGCLLLLAALRVLTQAPDLAAQWEVDAAGRPVVVASANPRLDALRQRALLRIEAGDQTLTPSATLLQTSPRWVVDASVRAALVQERRQLARMLAGPDPVVLRFDLGESLRVDPQPRGWRGLGLPFWLLVGPALLLYLVGAGVLLAHPQLRNGLYALMAACQSVSLLWLGLDAGQSLAAWPPWLVNDLPWRLGLDLVTAAAGLHLFTLHPMPLVRAQARPIAILGWLLAAGVTALAASDRTLHGLWWIGQGTVYGLALAAYVVITVSHRRHPHPFAAAIRRLGVATLATLLVMQVAVVVAQAPPGPAHDVSVLTVLVWTLFFASLLLWVPFLSRGRQVMRELAMLAGLCTVAVSLDLLLGTLLSLDQLASLTLAGFIALGAYAAARRWLLGHLVGPGAVTTERAFEHLYRIARDLQKHPDRQVPLVGDLMHELFGPLEIRRVPQAVAAARVAANGAALIVPVLPGPGGSVEADGHGAMSLVLRHARGGQRLFTQDDARLTDRVVEQLRRAVAYDRAVERGRSEERLRIAQDLHDDIGARLLTLMYKAQDPEVEEYIRHTLQDLKTLTRGLATGDHKLSHAVPEWKADLQQRLTAADVQFGWSFTFDEDLELSVVQWSALTRVLRELVSNTLAHAHAARVEINATVEAGRLTLTVTDDGDGREPAGWSHGLGLGGIRKRVKQLGGSVAWREAEPRGIVCEVTIPGLAVRA